MEARGRNSFLAAAVRPADWDRRDWQISAALFTATLLSRLPFRTSLLYAWDSVLYARAIADFNAAANRPQPPGHIFYVWLARLIDVLTGDANAAMVWVSILAAAAAAAMLYRLGRMMFGRPPALVASLLLATSLSFWVYSEIAYPYTLLAFLSTALAAVIYQTWQGRTEYVAPAALLLGLAAGFRQDLLPFMLPLLLAGWIGKPPLRAAAAAGLLAAASLAWFIPAALLSGGFSAYDAASSAQSTFLIRYSSVFGAGIDGLKENFGAFVRFLAWGLSAAAVALALAFAGLAGRHGGVRADRRLWFLGLWAAPSVLFYIFIHIGEYGYVFSFLPALMLAGGWGVVWLARRIGRARGSRHSFRLVAALTAPLVAINIALFVIAGTPMSAPRLAARDNLLQTKIETIRSRFDPASTLIISVFDEQEVDYYLAAYRCESLDPMSQHRVSYPLPPSVSRIVIFDDYLTPVGAADRLPLMYDEKLAYLIRQPGDSVVRIDWDSKEVSLADK